MDGLRDVATVVLLVSGLSFMLIGAWGTVRLPDAYHRLHAATKCSTLGLLGLLGLVRPMGWPHVLGEGFLARGASVVVVVVVHH